MKKTTKTALIALFVGLSIAVSGCARQPSEKRGQKLIKSYFKKYGKKYHETVYGRKVIKDVDIIGQEEIHKHLVSIEAFITFDDGFVQRIFVTAERGPLGWRFISWENAT